MVRLCEQLCHSYSELFCSPRQIVFIFRTSSSERWSELFANNKARNNKKKQQQVAMASLLSRFQASMVLAAVGDAVGFKVRIFSSSNDD